MENDEQPVTDYMKKSYLDLKQLLWHLFYDQCRSAPARNPESYERVNRISRNGWLDLPESKSNTVIKIAYKRVLL
ncbi:MAG: hypothetical protein JXB42_07870 [Deltaproteobacteria bacterium]|nr:hypothetical protein [Deltaproteobacteria bacterium]